MSYLLALDQGTTSSRAIIFNEHGKVQATAQRETHIKTPQSGWVDQDPLGQHKLRWYNRL